MEDVSAVQLITRPRRFGKTLLLDALKCFLQVDFTHPGRTDRQAALFAGLKISESADFCRRFMGQHPVISLSLKDVDGKNFAEAYQQIAGKLASEASLPGF